jgi:hypothetical protein
MEPTMWQMPADVPEIEKVIGLPDSPPVAVGVYVEPLAGPVGAVDVNVIACCRSYEITIEPLPPLALEARAYAVVVVPKEGPMEPPPPPPLPLM